MLLDPVFVERPARLDAIIIAAKGVAAQRQENALLILPDMGHFMDEKPLPLQIATAKIVAEKPAFGMKMDRAKRGHNRAFWLEKRPFAVDDFDARIINRIAKD